MKIGIIADDLTGANGTGVKLAEQGIQTFTHCSDSDLTYTGKDIAVCIDTDSRYAPVHIVERRIDKAFKKLKNWNADVICKRIDSTFRGNIGVELDTLLNNLGSDAVAIIVPSYPDSGRMVVGSYLIVNGKPLSETDVAKDPIRPLKYSYLPKVLEEQTNSKVASICIDTVGQGISKLEMVILKNIEEGIRLILCDAVTEKHIQMIAIAMANIKNKKLIPVDPGPLTNYFIENARNDKTEQNQILISIGSATKMTTNQIKYLQKRFKLKSLYVQANQLASFSNTWNDEVERVVHESVEMFKNHSIIFITTNTPEMKLIDFGPIAKRENTTKDLLAKRITDGLAEISKQIITLSNGKIKGCFFSGGDVTASFSQAVQATGIRLEEEVMPIVAYGELIGGPFDGLPVITKGGLIGEDDALYQCIRYLRKRLVTKRERIT